MNLLKVKIHRVEDNFGTHYEYPKPYYDAKKVVFGPIYEGKLSSNIAEIRTRKSDYEFILIGVKSEDAQGFLEGNNKTINSFTYEIVEITKDEALDYGNKWTEQLDVITDLPGVIHILAKSARGEELSQENKDSINPDHSSRGINRTKTFQQQLEEFLE